MPRTFALLFALATLSVGAQAQSADPAGQGTLPNYNQTQAAPIVRTGPVPLVPRIATSQPVAGVWLQAEANSSVKTISTDPNKTEIHVERGRINVQVHHPADHAQILIDLPGGQTTLLKDGLYTFNAETNTVRVLHGEAEVYSTPGPGTAKPIKVKEDHELIFAAGANSLKAREADPREMVSDLLPAGRPGPEGYGGGGYGYGPYGDGYPYVYPYPYYAYGYGYPWGYYPYYGWGYPYGYGYPYPYMAYGWGYPYYGYGYGIGFGYYGGGFRGRGR